MYPTKFEEFPKFLELLENVTREQVDETEVRCPDPDYAEKFRNVSIKNLYIFNWIEIVWYLIKL